MKILSCHYVSRSWGSWNWSDPSVKQSAKESLVVFFLVFRMTFLCCIYSLRTTSWWNNIAQAQSTQWSLSLGHCFSWVWWHQCFCNQISVNCDLWLVKYFKHLDDSCWWCDQSHELITITFVLSGLILEFSWRSGFFLMLGTESVVLSVPLFALFASCN